MEQRKNVKMGIISAIIAYSLWGILPIYWKFVFQVPAHEILAHRIFWSFIFMLGILVVANQKKKFYQEMKQLTHEPKKLLALTMGSFLISINWFIYIWAVNNNRVIETSLGYYINPLFSVLLGIFVLKERLSFWQLISVCLAMSGVLYMTMHFGSVPWVAVLLAISFGFYGLCKKVADITPITSITLETLIMTPFALAYILYLDVHATGSFAGLSVTSVLLIGSGMVTAIPLLLFANSANQLSLITLGFIQYLSPTIALMIGIFLYREPFTQVHFVSFGLIWAALLVFSLSRTKVFLNVEISLREAFAWKKGHREN